MKFDGCDARIGWHLQHFNLKRTNYRLELTPSLFPFYTSRIFILQRLDHREAEFLEIYAGILIS